MSRGKDSETGLPMCHVRRITADVIERAIVWRLVRRPNGWYNVGQYIGDLKGYRPTPEKHGVKLSNSRTDLMLQSFADCGHGEAYV